MKLEHVESVVVTDNVVHLLWLDAASEINFGIDDAFIIDQALADDAAIGADDPGEGA